MTTTIINLKSQRRPRSDSIGPATTPDIQSNLLTIPFQPDLFNVALERNVSIQSIRIKKGKGKEIIIESDEDEDDDDEESEVQEEGVDDEEEESNELDWEMKYLGFSMISFSFLAFTFGVWSIAIGPFLDQTGLLVSLIHLPL